MQSGLPTTFKLPRATWDSAATNETAHGAPNALTLDVELQQLLPLDVELLPLQLPPPWSAKLLLLNPLDIEFFSSKLEKSQATNSRRPATCNVTTIQLV